jgi:uncharacterized membrane protein HdeD (DUF308 family)
MLFRELDKIRRNIVMGSIIEAIMGLVLLATPDGYVGFLGAFTAFVLVVAAVVYIMEFMVGRKALIDYFFLLVALVVGLVGILMFVYDDLFIALLTLLVSVQPLLVGVYTAHYTIAFARRSGRAGWWLPLVMAALLIAFGAFTLLNPWVKSPRAVLQLAGGTLTYSAIVMAALLIWVWPIPYIEES